MGKCSSGSYLLRVALPQEQASKWNKEIDEWRTVKWFKTREARGRGKQLKQNTGKSMNGLRTVKINGSRRITARNHRLRAR